MFSSPSPGGVATTPAQQLIMSIHNPTPIVGFMAGIHRSLHHYSHYIAQVVRDNKLPDAIVDTIYDGGKNKYYEVWAAPPKGVDGSAKTGSGSKGSQD